VVVRIDEREGARPPDAGPLQKELDEEPKTAFRCEVQRAAGALGLVTPAW
jgi:hypothetical protein